MPAPDSTDQSNDDADDQLADKKVDPGHTNTRTTSSTTRNVPPVTITSQTSPGTNTAKVVGDVKIHTSTNSAAQVDSPSTTTQLPEPPKPDVEVDPKPIATITCKYFAEQLFFSFLVISEYT
jgi:hypothetical protein